MSAVQQSWRVWVMRSGGRFCGGCRAVSTLVGLTLLGLTLVAPVLGAAGRPDAGHVAVPLMALPAGITLPVALVTGLQAGKTRSGTAIRATTTQRVPLGGDHYLERGAVLMGEVVASDGVGLGAGRKPMISMRFTSLRDHHQTIPLRSDALAVANFTQVEETFQPVTGIADRGNPSAANWTTQQVGGDQVFRSGWVGPVCNRVLHTVGYADFHGVYSLPLPLPDGGAALPRALGVFSADARGLYGFEEGVTLMSNGGVITVAGGGGKLEVRSGDALLLQVLPGQ